ncbi:DUF3489 domain-containing protein [Methylibium sp.]|uniref:DUF3489 domain-containing protein n=1 Tax=Methylibium sp. TaxID=2067992 RepID=UPI003D0E20EF
MTIRDPSADYFILIQGAHRGTGVMRAAERSSSASTRRVAPCAVLPTTSRNVPFRAVAMLDDCFDGVAKGRYPSRRSHRPTGVRQIFRKTGATSRSRSSKPAARPAAKSPARPRKPAAAVPAVAAGSKQSQLIALLRSTPGATLPQMTELTGWQPSGSVGWGRCRWSGRRRGNCWASVKRPHTDDHGSAVRGRSTWSGDGRRNYPYHFGRPLRKPSEKALRWSGRRPAENGHRARRPRHAGLTRKKARVVRGLGLPGGEGGIRTHGTLRYA